MQISTTNKGVNSQNLNDTLPGADFKMWATENDENPKLVFCTTYLQLDIDSRYFLHKYILMVPRLDGLTLNKLVCNKVITYQYGNQTKQLTDGTNIVCITVLTIWIK